MEPIRMGYDRMRRKRCVTYLVTMYEFVELKSRFRGRPNPGEYRVIEPGRIAVWDRESYTEYMLG